MLYKIVRVNHHSKRIFFFKSQYFTEVFPRTFYDVYILSFPTLQRYYDFETVPVLPDCQSSHYNFQILLLIFPDEIFLPMPLKSVAKGIRATHGYVTVFSVKERELRIIFDRIFYKCSSLNLKNLLVSEAFKDKGTFCAIVDIFFFPVL